MGRLLNFFRTNYRAGEPLRHLCSTKERNFLNSVLEDIQGIGCRVVKPIDKQGRGWRIIVDGTTDIPFPEDDPEEAATPPYHLQCFAVDSLTLGVRGASLVHYCGGDRIDLDLAAAGAEYTEHVALELPEGSGPRWVIVAKNDDRNPTGWAAAIVDEAPEVADRSVRTIAHFEADTGAFAGGIFQDWQGGNPTEYWLDLDLLSMDFVPDDQQTIYDRLQWRKFHDAANNKLENLDTALDLFGVKRNADSTLYYVSADDIWDALDITWDDIGGDPEPALSGIWWKLDNELAEDAYGAVIGRTISIVAIDLTNMRLHDTHVTYTLDWSTKQFLGDWTGTGSISAADEVVGDSGGTFTTIIGAKNQAVGIWSTNGSVVTTICDATWGIAISNGAAESSGGYYVGGTQVLTDQQPAIDDIDIPAGSLARDGALRLIVNEILAMNRTHGFLGT